MANRFLLDVFENILINSVIHNDNSIVGISIRISNIQEERKQFLKAEFIDNGVGLISKSFYFLSCKDNKLLEPE